jgi:hypothetical protein
MASVAILVQAVAILQCVPLCGMSWEAVSCGSESSSDSDSRTSGGGDGWSAVTSSSESDDFPDWPQAGDGADVSDFMLRHGMRSELLYTLALCVTRPAASIPKDELTSSLLSQFLGPLPPRNAGKTLEAALLGMNTRQFDLEFESLAMATLMSSRLWVSSFCSYLLDKVDKKILVPHVCFEFFMAAAYKMCALGVAQNANSSTSDFDPILGSRFDVRLSVSILWSKCSFTAAHKRQCSFTASQTPHPLV